MEREWYLVRDARCAQTEQTCQDCPPQWTFSTKPRWPRGRRCVSLCAGVSMRPLAGRKRCDASLRCPSSLQHRYLLSLEVEPTQVAPTWTAPLWSQCRNHPCSVEENKNVTLKEKKTFSLKCMDLLWLITTHHVHEQVAVDLSVVFLHFLLDICSRQLLLSPFSLFILEGTGRSYSVKPPGVSAHHQTTNNTPEYVNGHWIRPWVVTLCS